MDTEKTLTSLVTADAQVLIQREEKCANQKQYNSNNARLKNTRIITMENQNNEQK